MKPDERARIDSDRPLTCEHAGGANWDDDGSPIQDDIGGEISEEALLAVIADLDTDGGVRLGWLPESGWIELVDDGSTTFVHDANEWRFLVSFATYEPGGVYRPQSATLCPPDGYAPPTDPATLPPAAATSMPRSWPHCWASTSYRRSSPSARPRRRSPPCTGTPAPADGPATWVGAWPMCDLGEHQRAQLHDGEHTNVAVHDGGDVSVQVRVDTADNKARRIYDVHWSSCSSLRADTHISRSIPPSRTGRVEPEGVPPHRPAITTTNQQAWTNAFSLGIRRYQTASAAVLRYPYLCLRVRMVPGWRSLPG
jgi:hypothetical protein